MTTALFVFILASACLAGLVLVLVMVLGTERPQTEKLSAYECGFEPFGDARESFDVKFYRVGLMFLVFDIEVAFRFPWAVLVLTGSKVRLWLIFVFSLILIAGFVLEMKLGVLDWKWKATLTLSNCVSTTIGSSRQN